MFLDFLFPKNCVICGRGGTLWCSACQHRVPAWEESRCGMCLQDRGNGLCELCRPHTYLSDLRIASVYDNAILSRVIQSYKYSMIRDLSVPLSHLLLPLISDLSLWPIACVPQHPKRFRERGFSPLELFVAHTARKHFPLTRFTGLTRVRYHGALVGKTAAQRAQEIHGAFRVTQKPPRRLILLDDVMSSGATLNECAKMLTFAGCDQIIGLILARKL